MIRFPATTLFAVAALATAALAQSPVYFAAALDGAQEVPANASTGRGFGIVRFDPTSSQVQLFVAFQGLTGAATAAHLHDGATGVNGPVMVPLAAGASGWTGTGTLTAVQAASLQAGTTYLNVHTATNPGGEIRGQVVLADVGKYTAALTGGSEVPPNASTATGTAVAYLHKPENRLVYLVSSTGLANVTAAHFHMANPGVNGPVVVPLTGSNGNYAGASAPLTTAQVTALEANGFYVNIHTSTFPGGEIRGQVNRVVTPNWAAPMSGANEVPPTPSTGFGEGTLQIGDNGAVSVVVNYSGLSGTATASHIHLGAVGVNGPVVLGLTAAGAGRYSLNAVLSATQIADLQAGRYYVNVHTSTFPGGEIRGQLAQASVARPFGRGCPGSNGTAPVANLEGIAAVGATFAVKNLGAVPNALCALAIGFNRDAAGPAALPLLLSSAGLAAPNCFLFTDPAGTVVSFSDALGTANASLGIALVPALRGTIAYGQWFVFDAAANTAGLVTSNAVTLRID